MYSSTNVQTRGTSILGEVRNVEISGVTQQLLRSKSHDPPNKKCLKSTLKTSF